MTDEENGHLMLCCVGWTKEKIQAFLWENTKMPWPMVQKTNPADKIEKMIKVESIDGALRKLVREIVLPSKLEKRDMIID